MFLDITTPAIVLSDGQATAAFLVFFVGILVAACLAAPKEKSSGRDEQGRR